MEKACRNFQFHPRNMSHTHAQRFSRQKTTQCAWPLLNLWQSFNNKGNIKSTIQESKTLPFQTHHRIYILTWPREIMRSQIQSLLSCHILSYDSSLYRNLELVRSKFNGIWRTREPFPMSTHPHLDWYAILFLIANPYWGGSIRKRKDWFNACYLVLLK